MHKVIRIAKTAGIILRQILLILLLAGVIFGTGYTVLDLLGAPTTGPGVTVCASLLMGASVLAGTAALMIAVHAWIVWAWKEADKS